jgi:hypothetical protein
MATAVAAANFLKRDMFVVSPAIAVASDPARFWRAVRLEAM